MPNFKKSNGFNMSGSAFFGKNCKCNSDANKSPLKKKNDDKMMTSGGKVVDKKMAQNFGKDMMADKAADDSQTKIIAGQYLEKTKDGYKDVDTGKMYKDPNKVIKLDKDGFVPDNDYRSRGGNIIKVD